MVKKEKEEPENMGAWRYIESRIENCLNSRKHKNARPKYIGRVESASPAAGYQKMHIVEQTKLIEQAIKGV